jgi:mono/diheme cytochrome c family protein
MRTLRARSQLSDGLYNNCLLIVSKNRLWIAPLMLSAALLVLSCKPESPPPAPKALNLSEEHGQRLYKSSCATCHRADSGAPLAGPGMQGLFKKPYLPSGAPANDERVQEVIIRGRRSMPGFGQIYDESQIRDIIAYLRTL